MDQKHVGIILIIASVLMGSFVYVLQSESKQYADEYMLREGTCFLEDGTCLHARNMPFFVFGWGISAALFLFGIYLSFIDKTQKVLAENQLKLSSALESAKKQEREKDEFSAFLAGFDDEKQRVLKAVKEQPGITQSTLRYRADISKTALSLVLSELEEKAIIRRKPSGKTKEVYLVKKF
jgi:ribosomal protein S25